MILSNMQKLRLIAVAVALTCMAAPGKLAAQHVVYVASGTFTLISGNDLFQLRNEPFSIQITGSEGAVPTQTGTGWAQYGNLGFSGTVTSGVTGTPISLNNNNTSIILAVGNPTFDFLDVGTGFKILSLPIGMVAKIAMRKGTLANTQILPFTHGVQLSPTSSTLTYSGTVNGVLESTTLGMSGTIFTKVTATGTPAAATSASLMLHAAGAQSVTNHPDGTKSVRPIGGGVDLGAPADKVALRFYASGVGA